MHKEILDDILKDSPCMKNGFCDDKEGHWCILREIILNFQSDEMAEQLKLMYDYKYMRSKKEGYDIGTQQAFHEFMDRGHAKKFHEIYQDGMKNDELFEGVFGFKKQHTDKDLQNHINN
ncbi:hypothetical protein M0R19_00660 [Candidatus Pacearchaeota archaeon]|jgi:hypothetical protein|nr:hypothetical protein [Candidatus Pacearchaeota archaeon]